MSIARKAVLTVTANPLVTKLVSKYGMKLGASRFVAGENMADTIRKVKELNREGLVVTLDLLGESVTTRDEATAATQAAVDSFEVIREEGVDSNVSVKLTQLGLDIDFDFCLENMDRIAAKAKETDNFVRIDMEDSPRVEATMEIFKKLLAKYGKKHIGLVIQSYLYRSEKDVEELGELGANLRIVKGAYKEPKDVAYPDKKDVDENYLRLVETHLKNGCYTAVATHDENIIQWTKNFVQEHNIPNDQFEFQMLFGIRETRQRELAKEGYKVRVYTPYGKDWYPYFSRRIAERPANALFVLKSLFQK
ncbi:L-proline dehydrogenase [Melghirimyces profundicolus]|uniref:proline dehydrogenase n=1 Tax=Melghirimyces profundicolus TaxID=1242148 RepID=A0A2T6BXV1_9BACL|nr:proline dehydrogenase family protein [Melghirimyces profundicolus]PTX60807.1 L-proline dehydrogenase [Melghirimyces profundicolus]